MSDLVSTHTSSGRRVGSTRPTAGEVGSMRRRSYTRFGSTLGSSTRTRTTRFGSNPVAHGRSRPTNTGVSAFPAHSWQVETTKVHGGSSPRWAYLIRPANTGRTVHTSTCFGSSSVAVATEIGSKGSSDA